MTGLGRFGILVALTSGVITAPLRADGTHCRAAEEPAITTPAAGPLTEPMAVHAAAPDLGEAPCAACSMPGCPVSMCPGGVPMISESGVVLAEIVHSAVLPSDRSGASSRTLQPPTPPPNRSRYLA